MNEEMTGNRNDEVVKVNRQEVTPASYAVENEEAFIVKIELPGVTEKATEINLENKTLSVTAENEVGNYEDHELVLREIPEIRYRTAFDLPERVDAARIKASMKSGILILTLPKREEVKAHKIDILSE